MSWINKMLHLHFSHVFRTIQAEDVGIETIVKVTIRDLCLNVFINVLNVS